METLQATPAAHREVHSQIISATLQILLGKIVLARGSHAAPAEGISVMEAASIIGDAGRFTDHPTSVSPVIGAFLREFNDALDDQNRQYVIKLARPTPVPV